MLLLNDPATVAWVANQCEADPRIAYASVGWTRDEEHTCGVFYENFTGKCITAAIAVASGAVFPKEFLKAIFSYPFVTLGADKMLALVSNDNWKSVSMVEKMGFKPEAVITGYYPDSDLIIYSMLKSDCKYLEQEHGKED